MAQSIASPSPSVGIGAPTVVLVHWAFADGSSWSAVIRNLQQVGIHVVAPANPLRGVSGDAAYIASFVSQIQGRVLLVGHSYGGAVITNAASQTRNVIGLVYVAAFIPDQGETLQALSSQPSESVLGPALRPAHYPTPNGGKPGTEFSIDPASFHAAFCADLPADQAANLAALQRPLAELGFGEPTQQPAWKTLPSWAIIGTADNGIGITGLRQMTKRAGAITVETDASHVVMLSQPAKVAELIRTALGSVS